MANPTSDLNEHSCVKDELFTIEQVRDAVHARNQQALNMIALTLFDMPGTFKFGDSAHYFIGNVSDSLIQDMIDAIMSSSTFTLDAFKDKKSDKAKLKFLNYNIVAEYDYECCERAWAESFFEKVIPLTFRSNCTIHASNLGSALSMVGDSGGFAAIYTVLTNYRHLTGLRDGSGHRGNLLMMTEEVARELSRQRVDPPTTYLTPNYQYQPSDDGEATRLMDLLHTLVANPIPPGAPSFPILPPADQTMARAPIANMRNYQPFSQQDAEAAFEQFLANKADPTSMAMEAAHEREVKRFMELVDKGHDPGLILGAFHALLPDFSFDLLFPRNHSMPGLDADRKLRHVTCAVNTAINRFIKDYDDANT